MGRPEQNLPTRAISKAMLPVAFAAACGLLLATISPYVYKAFVGYYSTDPEAMATELFEEFWQWRLKDSPEFATMVGFHGYDHLLESYSIKSFQDRKEKIQYFLKKAEKLPKLENQWSAASLNILIDGLDGYLRGLDTHGHLYPISFIEGVHVDIFQTIDYMMFNTVEDFKKLLSRYEKLPKQLEEITELMKEGIKLKKTAHAVSMKHVLERLASFEGPAENSEFFQRFEKYPDTISEQDRKVLRQDAVKVIETSVLPAFSKLRKFIKEEYVPHLRPEIAATSLPAGEVYYKECLRYHLELDLTPQEVHQLGLDEVKRISDSMKQIIKSLGSDASPKEFSAMIRNDSSFLCKSSEEVVRMYEQLLEEEINPKLLTIFPSVPKSPLRVQLQDASKSSGPCAMYIQGTTDFSRPGIFYVNAADLTRSPKYLMAALALHEGNPGHHLQGSYAMELPSMPAFRSQIEDRRYNDGPVHFPLHTAYVEVSSRIVAVFQIPNLDLQTSVICRSKSAFGVLNACVAAYKVQLSTSSCLHHNCGIDKSTLNQRSIKGLGRAAVESWRKMCCRCWSSRSRRALGCEMSLLTALKTHSFGQVLARTACAYKVGELKIKQLRQKAQDSLGAKFDVRAFHKVILDNPGPLTFLEKQVNKHILETKGH
ncbi:uncharacterized protein LOC119436920 [Dermacentor silvarum]|uniref:uncharacterized protein LOC119436920 n=1 Tax=Dermacentor silvarum TaxID=543639 RepID=UPI00210145BC|nr:uncharacterized protein LOC119436920 [Dermacentor silvarum]